MLWLIGICLFDVIWGWMIVVGGVIFWNELMIGAWPLYLFCGVFGFAEWILIFVSWHFGEYWAARIVGWALAIVHLWLGVAGIIVAPFGAVVRLGAAALTIGHLLRQVWMCVGLLWFGRAMMESIAMRDENTIVFLYDAPGQVCGE